MKQHVAVAFTPAPATQIPNLRRTTDRGAAAAYYRAIFVTFASVRRWNSDLELSLVTDTEPPPSVAKQLSGLGVRLVHAPFEHQPPQGFWPIFNASLYSIDAMAELARCVDTNDRVLLLDPDVLCTAALTPAFDSFEHTEMLVYPTGFPVDEMSQGLSALDAAPLHQSLDGDLSEPPLHYGGELYGFTPEGAAPVLERAEDAWRVSLANWADGRPYFVTEEHIFNYALRRATLIDAAPFIRRIWTAPVYRTVVGDETELLLWHLPSEKDRGFVRLASAATGRQSWFWTAGRTAYLRQAGGLLGIPHRRPKRFLYDVAGGSVRSIQRSVRRRR